MYNFEQSNNLFSYRNFENFLKNVLLTILRKNGKPEKK